MTEAELDAERAALIILEALKVRAMAGDVVRPEVQAIVLFEEFPLLSPTAIAFACSTTPFSSDTRTSSAIGRGSKLGWAAPPSD